MDLDEDYRCQFCQEFYDNDIHCPRILPKCGHTICTSCIINKLSDKTSIVCPDDGIATEDLHSLEALPINKTLLSIISSIDYARKSTNLRTSLKSMPMQTCHEHFLPLSFICFNHHRKICGKCRLTDEHIKDDIVSEETMMNTIDSLIDLFQEIDMNVSAFDMDEGALPNADSTFEFIITQINAITTEVINVLRERSNNLIGQLMRRRKELQLMYDASLVKAKELIPKSKEWLKVAQGKLEVLNEISDASGDSLMLLERNDFNPNGKLIGEGNELVKKFDCSQREINAIKADINDYCEKLNVIQSKRIVNEIEAKALVLITEEQGILRKLQLKEMFEKEEGVSCYSKEEDDSLRIQLNSKQPFEKAKIVFIKSQLKKETANFSRIDIGDEGAELIGDFFLKTNLSHIKELKMVKSNITDKGLTTLLPSLSQSSNTLTSLNFSNNSLTDKSVEAIAQFLRSSSSLQVLTLSQNFFTEASKDRLKASSSVKLFI